MVLPLPPILVKQLEPVLVYTWIISSLRMMARRSSLKTWRDIIYLRFGPNRSWSMFRFWPMLGLFSKKSYICHISTVDLDTKGLESMKF